MNHSELSHMAGAIDDSTINIVEVIIIIIIIIIIRQTSVVISDIPAQSEVAAVLCVFQDDWT